MKFIGASMFFDLCFNIPNTMYRERIHKMILAKLTDKKTPLALLTQAYQKIESYERVKTFDPILDALYAANHISTLENEDASDSEMQNLFQFYSDSHMLVSIHSNIIEEVILFQKLKVDYDVFTAGENYNEKLSSLFYYDVSRL